MLWNLLNISGDEKCVGLNLNILCHFEI